MKKWILIAVVSLAIVGFTSISKPITDPEVIKKAVNKSLPLLQSSSYTFLINAGGCHSCHGQALGGVAFSLAKEKGFPIQDTILQQALDSINNDWTQRRRYMTQNGDPAAIVLGGGYDLWAFAANKLPGNKTRELLAKNILQRQRKDGSWVAPNARPPIEYYSFSATAMAVKGMQVYLPAVLQTNLQHSIARATTWMMTTTPLANEEKIFQLLGLKWVNGDKNFIQQQAGKLIAAQHPDGGWSQLDSLQSDAYATGQSLYALQQSGAITTAAPAYQKGIAYLLRTQQADGSWNVQTRSYPSIPFVESGFPHGDNQFISAAGTNWAVMALMLAVEKF